MSTVREHLIRNRRHQDFRVWRGPGDPDSSDEEWEANFWTPNGQQSEDVDPEVDTHRMVDDAFQRPEESAVLEDQVQEVLRDAFSLADGVHAKCMRDGKEDQDPTNDIGNDEPVGESTPGDAGEDRSFDPHA